MPKRQYTTTTEEGFKVRLEARLKNAELIGAREMAGLTAREVAERTGISYVMYLGCESMREYPNKEMQKKICDFYRSLGIFLFEDDVFPEELKKLKPEKKYIHEKTIPKIELLSLSTGEFDRKLLPAVEGEAEKKVEYDELHAAIYEILSKLPHRQQEVIRMRFGIEDEEPKTCEEIGKIFDVTKSRIQQIEAKALMKIKLSLKLKSFLESSSYR
jgi:RNA polymerase sigma factor (sigma-70 family)